jgi:hypothetical protein
MTKSNPQDNTGQTPAEYYTKERNSLNQDLIRESSKSDNAKLLVITGTILLSINFAATLETIQDKLWLIGGLIFLVFALIFHLMSFEYATKWYEDNVDKMDAWKENNFTPPQFKTSEKFKSEGRQANKWTFIFLVMGILTIGIFALINLI